MASAFWQSIIGIGAIGIPRPSLPVTAMVPQSLRAAARAQTGAVGPSMRLSAPAFAPIRAGVRLQQQRGAAPLQQHQRRQRQQRAATRARAVRVNALRNIDWPEALLFDCDGVLVDTEAEGHRVAFNAAFKRKGALPSRCVVLACRCPSLLQRGLVGKSWPFMLLGLRSSECLSR